MTDISHDDKNPFDDTIHRAVNIGKYLFAKDIAMAATDDERKKFIEQARRKVYHLVETSRLPVFRLGSTLVARKSVLKKFIEDQEKRTASKTKGFEESDGEDA
ncbi:hypothetical protein QWJ07_24455 [Frankia sp. RB7]|nr:hypothetical protein [Frankia sp. RB7]